MATYTPAQMAAAILAIPKGTAGSLQIFVTVIGEDKSPASGAAVTASKDGSTYTGVETATAGAYEISVPEYGTYTVTAVYDGETRSKSVSLNETIGTLDFVLPDGYTRLQYIQSTGTQYINTELVPSGNGFRFVGKLMLTKFSGTDGNVIFGAYGNSPNYGRSFLVSYYGEVAVAAGRGEKGGTLNVNVVYEVDARAIKNALSVKLNGNEQSLSYWVGNFSESLTSRPYFMFCQDAGGSPVFYASLILYDSVSIYNDSDELIAMFWPAKRDSDGKIGMYDTVRKQFFTNAGSGSFIAGPEVS